MTPAGTDLLEALLRAALDDLLGPTDRVLWLTAAMTGLRQGELAGLRWRDVAWTVTAREELGGDHVVKTNRPYW